MASTQQKLREMEDEEVMTEAESDVTIQAERYAYAELKEAQRRCGEKAVAAALKECGSSSTAQQKVRVCMCVCCHSVAYRCVGFALS